MYDFINIDHIIENKTCLDKFKWLQIKQHILSIPKRIKLDIRNSKPVAKPPNTMKLNDIYLSNIKPKK